MRPLGGVSYEEVLTAMGTREYPSLPVIGVGGVVFIDGQVVLVKRSHPPLEGKWSLPGGAVEVGESLQDALRREVQEEVGIDVRVGPLIELLDRITRDSAGQVQYHYVLADYLCHLVAGSLRPGSDAGMVTLADPGDLSPYDLTGTTRAVIAGGLALV